MRHHVFPTGPSPEEHGEEHKFRNRQQHGHKIAGSHQTIYNLKQESHGEHFFQIC